MLITFNNMKVNYMDELNTYDEITHELIENPDLELGHVYMGTIITGYTEEKIEVMGGTVTEEDSEGLRERIPPSAIEEECWLYHTYTDLELESIKAEADRATKTYVDEKVSEAVTRAVSLAYGI